MSWLYSQALVAECSGGKFLDGELSAPSSTINTPQAYLWRDKTTDAWSRFPSGMTCEPLTEDHGEAVLMSFLEAFPARISVVQEQAQGLTEREVGSGKRWQGSFAKYDQDTSLWRTHQCSLLGDFTEFSETWPKWGSMQNGVCWERTMLVPTISEKEFGLWPTPVSVGLDGGSGSRKMIKRLTQAALQDQTKWPTPTVQDAKNNGGPSQHRRNNTPLNAMVGGKLNPTWVAWLMGWPLGWTDLNASAMGKYRQWRQQHLNCLVKGGQDDTRRIQSKGN